MSGRIGGWFKLPFNHVTFEINHYQIISLQFFIRNTARLDDDQTFIPVDPAHIAPGKRDKPIFGQIQIRLQHSLL